MRDIITFADDGSRYYGSQIQKEQLKTVIGELGSALRLLHIDSIPIASGRTDKGVHASAQVCHLDLPPFWNDTKKLKLALNRMLPPSIHIKNITEVSPSFHARYSAVKRTYRYIIKEGESNPFEANFVTFLEHVDLEKLKSDIEVFEGEWDFKNFQKTGSEVKSSVRTIYKAFTYTYKNYIILVFEANGFLRSQIRLMVGALLQRKKEEIEAMLRNTYTYKVRPAPPNGLYLAKIHYKDS